jgi:hypothetical protein
MRIPAMIVGQDSNPDLPVRIGILTHNADYTDAARSGAAEGAENARSAVPIWPQIAGQPFAFTQIASTIKRLFASHP